MAASNSHGAAWASAFCEDVLGQELNDADKGSPN